MKSIGVLGAGSIADVYVRNVARMRNCRVVAVAGLDAERSRARAAAWSVAGETPDGLIARDDIDIILNLTPPTAHYATTMAALKAGKHVFTEKPLGANLAEARDLLQFAAERGLRLGVAPDSILGAGVQRARAMLDAGAIGRPSMANAAILYHGAESWRPNPAFFYEPGGGPIHDVGPYFLATLMSLLGPVERVKADGFKGFEKRMVTAPGPQQGLEAPVHVLTSVLALLSFRSGVKATLVASWDVWGTSQPAIEIHGTEGSLSLPHPNFYGGPLQFVAAGRGWEEAPLDRAPLAVPNWPFERPEHCNYRGIGLAEMAGAIAAGRPHRASAELGAHVVEAADAIIASAHSGKTMELQMTPERPKPRGPLEAEALLSQIDRGASSS